VPAALQLDEEVCARPRATLNELPVPASGAALRVAVSVQRRR